MTGLQQQSVTPTLNTTLTPVLSLGSINEDPRSARPESYAALLEVVPDGVNVKRAVFANPLTSGRVAVLRRLHVYVAEDYRNAAANFSLVYDLQPLSGGLQFGNLKFGIRLVSGYMGHGGGVAAPTPPRGLDFDFQLVGSNRALPQSNMGWMAVAPNGIAGAYLWRGTINGTGNYEVLENFNGDIGPRMIVFPDGLFETYIIDANAHAYFNMWWDEYPLA